MSHKPSQTTPKLGADVALVPRLRFPEFREGVPWTVEAFSEVAEFVSEKISLEQIELDNYVSTENLLADYGGVTRASKLPTTGSATRFRPNDTLVSNIRPYLKKVWFSNKDGGASNDVIVIRAKHKLLTQYLPFLLKNDSFIDYVMTGAKGVKMPRGDIDSMKDYPTPFSAPPEQQKIADCLTSLDELIAAQARKVDALKTHKKGLMQQLFSREGQTQPGLRFPEFQDHGEWTVSSIQELIDKKFIAGHLDGNHGSLYPRAEEFSDSGVPYISATNFNNGGIDFGRCRYFSTKRAAQFKKGIARDGDILFAHNATVGPVAKLNTKHDFVILSTSLTYFRCNCAFLSSDFLQCILVSPGFVDQCDRVMSQSTRNQIPITTQRTFSLQLPTLPEQLRIADCFTSLDTLITATAQELDTLKTHKKGLMQQLFPAPAEVVA